MNTCRCELLTTIRSLAAIAAVLLTAAPALYAQDADPAFDLRPHFKPGRTARYRVWTSHEMTNKSPRGVVTNTRVFESEITWSVMEVRADGGADCQVVIDWLTCDLTTPDGSVLKNDSRADSGEVEAVHKLLVAVTGVPITVHVSGEGLIEGVSGTDAVRDAMENPDHAPDDQDYIEMATDLAMLIAAPPTIAPGGDWSTPVQWTHIWGHVNYDLKYELESVGPIAGIDVATVTGQSTSFNFEPGDDVLPVPEGTPPPEVAMSSAAVKTRVLFDLSRHEAVGRDTVETRSVDVALSIGDQTINMSMSERIHSQALRIAEINEEP